MTDQAALLRGYARAIDGARNTRQLIDYECVFLDRKGLNEVPDKWLPVRAAHRERIAGRGSPALCDEALNAALKEIAGQ